MWVFLRNAYLSIVEPDKHSENLLVRARVRGDIERVFPEAIVEETTERDYLFRALIPRQRVAEAMAAAVNGISYGNFKASVSENARHTAYYEVRKVMDLLQHKLKAKPAAKR